MRNDLLERESEVQALELALGELSLRQLGVLPPWITGHETTYVGTLSRGSVWAGLAQVALLAVAGWWLSRRRRAWARPP